MTLRRNNVPDLEGKTPEILLNHKIILEKENIELIVVYHI